MPTSTPKPWERLVGESSKWYRRFLFYMELGPERTMEQAFKHWWEAENAVNPRKRGRPKRPPSTWYDRKREFSWLERANAWDNEQSQSRLEEQAKAQKDMVERHIKIAMSLQTAGVNKLRNVLEEGQDNELSGREALAFLQEGVKLERQARGFPTETLEYYTLSDEELIEKYGQLYQRLEAAGGAGSGYEGAGFDATDEPEQPGDSAVPGEVQE